MDDSAISNTPAAIPTILSETRALGFDMISEPRVGSLLAGMDASATLDTVDNDPRVVAVAQRHLGADPRIRFHIKDGGQFLQEPGLDPFDLIYADAWPGKFSHLDKALALLHPGGLYVIDDLQPQPNWPEGHAPKVPALMSDLERRSGFVTVRMGWASGLMVVIRKAS
jgi:predicted O-methyltransferase YrrM